MMDIAPTKCQGACRGLMDALQRVSAKHAEPRFPAPRRTHPTFCLKPGGRRRRVFFGCGKSSRSSLWPGWESPEVEDIPRARNSLARPSLDGACRLRKGNS